MAMFETTTVAPARLTTTRAWAVEALLIGSSILLPIIAHLFAWPVLRLLPMFWGVLIAGMVYGWVGGLIAAVAAPLLNHVLTGMPAAAILPAMVVELIAYGTVPGLILRARAKMHPMLALAIGLVAGRIVLLGVWAATVGSPAGIAGFAATRLRPGVPVSLLQIALVPIAASWLKRAIGTGSTDGVGVD